MLLDDRKRRILQAIIDDYIDTAEPVGSRTIARKHELGLSSATIRNEMADLEEMGYLAQPHTSAGRVPSDKGYRLYVDDLMKLRQLSLEEVDSIREALEVRIHELSQLIKQASLIMSTITRYTSMAVTPQMKKSVIKAVQIVPIEQGKALVVVVTNTGAVRNNLIRIPEHVTPDYLIQISNIMHDRLSSFALEQLTRRTILELQEELGVPYDVLTPVLSGIAECIHQMDRPEVFLDGTTNIFNYPEFRDVMKAREFLTVLDEKAKLFHLLNTELSVSGTGINVKIGTENELNEIKDCSLITATYSFNNTVIGSIGVIGPTRMDYSKVISSMDYVRNKINQEIFKMLDERRE